MRFYTVISPSTSAANAQPDDSQCQHKHGYACCPYNQVHPRRDCMDICKEQESMYTRVHKHRRLNLNGTKSFVAVIL
jgi:hypothetical protein